MAEPETQHSPTSLLCTEERDFLLINNGEQVPVSELEGKTVGIYFSAHWCPPSRVFTPKLLQVYNKLKQDGKDFEIVFLSIDRDEEAFKEYHAGMPWLALPFGDKEMDLRRHFCIKESPSLVIVVPDGKTVQTDGRNILSVHGAKAYPFTDARLRELEKEKEAAAEKYPNEIKHDLHEHSLNLTPRMAYICDGCEKKGGGRSFYCKECDFDLHPDCALKDDHSDKHKKQ